MRTRLLMTSTLLLTACAADPKGGGPTGPLGVVDSGVPGSPNGGNGNPGLPGAQVTVLPGMPIDAGTPLEPISIDSCSNGAGGLDKASTDLLLAGGTQGGGRMLYPYDGTVFPRGLKAPLVMWDGVPGTTASYVHITASRFEYKGCTAAGAAKNQFQIPQEVWDAAGVKTGGKSDPFKVEITLLSQGKPVGPLVSQWTIAQATIKGSVYYNSYSSLKGIPGLGKVLRIPPKGDAEPFSASELNCVGCHSVSADGSRLVAQTLLTGGKVYNVESTPVELRAPVASPYAAVYPDGSRYLAASHAIEVARSVLSTGMAGRNAQMFETDTNMPLPSTGIPPGALMPSFSSDGKLLVFNDFAVKSAKGLALVDFNDVGNVGSNYRVIFEDTADMRPGWPFLLPDNKAVVFVRTNGGDFAANGAGLGGAITAGLGPYSELFIVDVDTKQSTLLARAMGYANTADAAAKKTYMPFGAEDTGKAYFPTISPVAAGGYFWVFYDAMRHYGNMGAQRQLWGTAVEISPNGDYAVDRSSPPFYLPGQEFGTGNHRAFTALDPCKQDGDKCSTGVDCCGGFCTLPQASEFGDALGTCTSTAACGKTDERCKTDADCCPPAPGQTANACFGGFCASVPILQ